MTPKYFVGNAINYRNKQRSLMKATVARVLPFGYSCINSNGVRVYLTTDNMTRTEI